MKLYCASTSPYSRKVKVVAIELAIFDRMQIRDQSPFDNTTGFYTINPLARIPVLETDDGTVLYDSPVICDYLNALARGSLIPATGPQRWDSLRRQALGDGMLDTALPLRGELLRTKELQSAELIARHRATVDRVLDAINGEPAIAQSATIDIGGIAIACALGWLQFRFPDWEWRAARAKLANWFDTVQTRPSFQSTKPS